MPLNKSQIAKALREGRRVLSREIVTEEEYLVDRFEWEWSYLVRTKQVPEKRGVLYDRCLVIFREKIRKNEMKEIQVRRWLRSLLNVEIPDGGNKKSGSVSGLPPE